MQNEIIKYSSYSHPEIEEHITSTKIALTDYAKIEGRHGGQQAETITKPVYTIKAKNYFKEHIIQLIEFIKQLIHVVPIVLQAKELEAAAKATCAGIQKQMHDLEHAIQALIRSLKAIVIDPFKLKYHKYLMPIALILGCGDGAMAFVSFRASYSFLLSLISSACITLVVSFSHFLYANWIQKTQSQIKRYIKVAVVLSVAFALFYSIANLRASAINDQVSIAIDGTPGAVISTPHVNAWMICIVSMILFAAVMFLALVLWMDKEERLKLAEYKKIAEEIKAKEKERAALKKQIDDISDNVELQKHNVRVIYDYADKSVDRAIGIGRTALMEFKNAYAQHHHTVPDFFIEEEDLLNKGNFKFFTTQN